jgi:protein-tyrosine phosphatase
VSAAGRVLFVCTGNMCRSIIAAALARRAFGAGFEVASAGIAAQPGRPPDPYALAALATLDALDQLPEPGPATGSRRLTPDLMVHSELILTATVAQRDAAVGRLAAASRRTFTLAEFARLAAGPPTGPPPTSMDGGLAADGAERLRRLVAEVARRRGQGTYVDPASEDIVDPRRRTDAVLACARLIARLVQDCATALGIPDHPAAVAGRL